MKFGKLILGYISIISIATTLPFALSNPELHNQWLMIALSLPLIAVVGWFMAEAMQQPYNNNFQPELKSCSVIEDTEPDK